MMILVSKCAVALVLVSWGSPSSGFSPLGRQGSSTGVSSRSSLRSSQEAVDIVIADDDEVEEEEEEEEAEDEAVLSASSSTPASSLRCGFVAVVGSANVGKSTLTNAVVGQDLCITTRKPQTTRHRILGIVNGEDYQIVLSDTPGVIESPAYALQQGMMTAAKAACRDSEVVLLLTDIYETKEARLLVRKWVQEQLPSNNAPTLIVGLNKVDELDEALEPVETALSELRELLPEAKAVVPLSARDGTGVPDLITLLAASLPESPERLFPDDDSYSDRPERFFAAELIRAALLENYRKEIPYSCEVKIERFKEPSANTKCLTIGAVVMVQRDSQKGIVIGAQGAAIKKLGISARAKLEEFFDQKIQLELVVKVAKDWRDDKAQLRKFGYPT